MKIIITNTVALNAGDAAILKGLIRIIESAFGNQKIDFWVYDSQPEVAKKYYPNIQFKKLLYFDAKNIFGITKPSSLAKFIKRLRLYFGALTWSKGFNGITRSVLAKAEIHTLNEYKSADLIISTGGTYLVENYDLEHRILDYEASLFASKPLIFFTQSLGPFQKSRNRERLKYFFEKSPLILLRDNKSKDHLLEIGVESKNIFVTSDAAFALSDLTLINAAKEKHTDLRNLKIAISVRDWKHFKSVNASVGQQRYLDALANLVIHLVETKQAKITFLSTCQGIPEYYLDDSIVASKIFEKLPQKVKENVEVNRDFHSPEDLAKIVSSYDLVVATRLHMAILSLGSGVPVFPIAYEFKTKELFEKLGQKKWTFDIEDIDSANLIQSMDNFLGSLDAMREPIFSKVELERKQAFESGLLVKKSIERFIKA